MLDEAEVLRSALEATPVGLCMVDRERKIFLWSDGAERIAGHLRQEVVGRPFAAGLLDYCDGKGAAVPDPSRPLSCALHSGRAADAVLYLKHKNGHRVPVRVFATAIRNGRGSLIGAMETFHEQTVVSRFAPQASENATQTQPHGMTVIPTRPLTLALLRESLGASRAQMMGCGVACVEVAHFEEFKTTYTQTAAHQMMDSIGSSIRQMLRQTDQVGRWSDSQLLVILPGCHASSLGTVAERLAAVAHRSHIRWWGDELSATVWVGAVMARPDESPEAIAARVVAAAEQGASRTEAEDAVLVEN